MRRLFVLIALIAQVGCFTTKSQGDKMQADILQLRGDLQALKGNLDAAKAQQTEQMQAAIKKLEDLSRALEDFNQSARTTDADFGSQMEKMISDLQALHGAVEVNEHRIGETETKLDQALQAKIQQLSAQNGNDTTDDSGSNAVKEAPKGKKEQLAYAAKLVKDGKVAEGRQVYRNIVKQWPKESGVTDEAEFRLGESYFDEKKYDAALREYIRVLDKFSAGALADDAYYKIGICSMESGNLEDAQTFFNEIVNNHKKSPLVKDAKAKIDEVQKRIDAKKKKGGGKKK